MEQIKGMSDADARRWLMKHGYGLHQIDIIMAGGDDTENPGAPESSAPAPKAEPKPEPVKAAPAPKAEPAPAPKPVAKPAPKASK